jgi:aldose 1-epimerase
MVIPKNIAYTLALTIATAGLGACSAARPWGNDAANTVAEAPAAATESPNPMENANVPETPPAITQAEFGVVDGKPVQLYTLRNKNGLVLKVTNYGATITEFEVPDRTGKLADIVLGFSDVDGYVKGSPFFGATIGRVANRIKNAKFELEGKQYKLEANDPPNHLHGGKKGWDKVLWEATASETERGPEIKLTYVSPDGEEGYPGTVTATTVYTLTHDNELRVEMLATTDKITTINMAHHTYWNLAGQDSGTILEHELQLFADNYTPGDPLPNGKVKAVKGTPFDFTAAKVIGKDLKEAGGKPVGFDHNFVVNGEPNQLRPVARLKDPKSGRVMTLDADQPGVQFYTGNFLDGSLKGKGEATYVQYSGLCLETQKFPNSINVPAWKNEVVLKPGQTYKHVMIHKFTAE